MSRGRRAGCRLGGHAEYADRVLIGQIELIVRDVDDKGKITGLGLSFEPTAPVARVPVFLSAGEMGDRLSAFIRNWRKPMETHTAEVLADEKPAPEPTAEKATTES
jgi:cell volume regulation protein A